MGHYAFRIVLGIAALWLSGCGEKATEVHGKVTYNGAPLNKSGGVIVFIGSKGEQVPVPIGEDGEYRSPGIAAGPNRVAVYYPNPAIKKTKAMARKGPVNSTDPPPPMYLTPEKYATVETSGLSVEITPGMEYNVSMEGPPIP